jgi:hypothetical protein
MPRLKLVSDGRRALEFSEARTLVGRNVNCDRVVDDRSVSRRHAFIEDRPDGWYVVDLGSSTGTFIDGLQVSEAPLGDGQELTLGTVGFQVEIEGTVRPSKDPAEVTTAIMARVALPEAPGDPEPAGEAPPEASQDGLASHGAKDVAGPAVAPVDRPRPSPPAPARPSPVTATGTSPLTVAMGVLALLLSGLAAYLWYRADELEASLAQLEASQLALQRTDATRLVPAETLEQKGALRNGPLRLCNRGPLPLEVTWLGAVYSEGGPSAEGADAGASWLYRVASFNSRTCDPDFKIVLPAGGEVTPRIEKCPADGRRFDGKALFYALSVKRAERAEPLFVSGLLSGGTECVEIGAVAPAPPSGTKAAATR